MRKNNLDEMQEKKLLIIEHKGMWFVFWGLMAAMLIQMCLGADFIQISGEWFVFMLLCFYLLVGCIKNGIWDRHLKPTIKTHVLISLLTSLVMFIVFGIVFYRHFNEIGGFLQLIIAPALLIAAGTFVLCLIALQLSSYVYKNRIATLEQKCDNENITK